MQKLCQIITFSAQDTEKSYFFYMDGLIIVADSSGISGYEVQTLPAALTSPGNVHIEKKK